MSNHQQPKQPIVMKLPIHATVNNETEIVIFTSSKEYPEDVEDWEIIDATQDSRKKCAAFEIIVIHQQNMLLFHIQYLILLLFAYIT
jgi:hypothetical protein